MVDEDLARILSVQLESSIEINDDVSMENTKKWDSLKHIEIIMSIEDFFKISFPPEEIPLLNTQQKILKKIRELQSEQIPTKQ